MKIYITADGTVYARRAPHAAAIRRIFRRIFRRILKGAGEAIRSALDWGA